MKMQQYKFWLKSCPVCSRLLNVIGANSKVTLKKTSIVCPDCGAELKFAGSPGPFAKFMFYSFFPVSFILLGASVNLSKPYSALFFYGWGVYALLVIAAIFGSYTLERK